MYPLEPVSYTHLYGRNYYTRHDYEAVNSDAANGLVNALRAASATLPGQRLGSYLSLIHI